MLARPNTRSSAFSRTAQVLMRIEVGGRRIVGAARSRAPASTPSISLAVGHVHLAAVGLEVDAALARRGRARDFRRVR